MITRRQSSHSIEPGWFRKKRSLARTCSKIRKLAEFLHSLPVRLMPKADDACGYLPLNLICKSVDLRTYKVALQISKLNEFQDQKTRQKGGCLCRSMMIFLMNGSGLSFSRSRRLDFWSCWRQPQAHQMLKASKYVCFQVAIEYESSLPCPASTKISMAFA